jgi:hypothetical protein
MNKKRSLLKFNYKTLLVASMICISSCKKESKISEPLNLEQVTKIKEYLKGPTMVIKNYSEVQNKLSSINLGTLNNMMSGSSRKEKLMSVNMPEVYEGFAVNKDSVIVISGNGHTSYVFQVALASPHSRSFQNLTIDESDDGIIAFVNTYTPSSSWISKWQSGQPGEFDGDISITRLNLTGNIITNTLESNGNSFGVANKKDNIISLNARPTLSYAQVCETTTYYYSVPYNCAGGNHGPGDQNCPYTGDSAAGYRTASATITSCTESNGGGGGGGGGGGTTPSVPPGYNPCPTTPVPVSRIRNTGKTFAVLPPSNTPCDPVIAPPVVTSSINNFIIDPKTQATYPRFTDMLKKLEGFVATDRKVMDALKLYSGFTEAEILQRVKWNAGPTIIIKELPAGEFGYFNPTESKTAFFVSASWARGLEATNLKETREATGFMLAVTVLHEFVHLARSANGLSNDYEYGFGFENVAFGMRVENAQALKYSYRLYAK